MDPTDQELFDAALSSEPTQEAPAEPAAQPEAQPAAVTRDEHGRFAPNSAPVEGEQQPVQTQAEQPAKSEPAIPPARLREEAEARRRAETRIAELERLLLQPVQPKPAEPAQAAPEFWDDPAAWVQSQLNPLNDELYTTRKSFSERLAVQQHGYDKVKAAYDALDQAVSSGAMNRQAIEAELRKSPDPAAEVMGWYEKTEPQRDPEAFKQRIIQEYLASQSQQPAATAPQGGSVVKLPPSLNRATSAASNNAPGNADLSDAALFSQTTARR